MPSSVDELTLAQVMLPEDANPRGNVHGGTLM
jgi:acyl-CoA hydrolase